MTLSMALACAFLLLSTAAMAGPADDALMRAIHAGDAIKAQQALREGARVNQPLPDGSLPWPGRRMHKILNWSGCCWCRVQSRMWTPSPHKISAR